VEAKQKFEQALSVNPSTSGAREGVQKANERLADRLRRSRCPIDAPFYKGLFVGRSSSTLPVYA
jgi:hypothetical protein